MNNKTIYRQADPRWAKLPFPGSGYTVKGCGCGLCAVTHVLIELDKYKNCTPKDFHAYMKQYATRKGLYHSGIPATLRHYGLEVVEIGARDPMSKAWGTLAKEGYRAGVLLFYDKNGPDGTVWTVSGHFVNFVDYKIQNGKHWFYLKDSGDRESWHTNINGKRVYGRHNGWWCYENSMRGDLPKLWIAKIPGGKTEKKSSTNTVKKEEVTKKVYSGSLPKVEDKKKLLDKAKSLAWAKGTSSKKYAYKGGNAKTTFKTALKKVFPDSVRASWGKPPRDGASCDVAVATVIRSSIDPKFPRGLSEQSPYTSDAFKKIVKKNYNPMKSAQVGDVIWYDYKGPGAHICILGDGVIYQANYNKDYLHTTAGTKQLNHTFEKVIIFRPKYAPLKKGSEGPEVLKWQKFLNAYFGKKILSGDSKFGPVTENYTKLFQKRNGIGDDGVVGPITIGKAKVVKF